MSRLTSLHVHPLKSGRRLSPQSAAVEPWGLAGDRRWMLADPSGRFVSQREHPRLALVRAEPRPDGGLLLAAPGARPLEVAAPSAERGDPTAGVEVWGTPFRAAVAAAEAHAWFSALFGADLRLVHLDDPLARPADPEYAPGVTVSMADGFPLLLAATASLDALNAAIAADHAGGPDPEAGAPVPMERFRPNLVVGGTEPWAEDGWRRIRVGEVVFRVVKPCGRCVITTTDQETGTVRGPEPLRALGRHRRIGRRLLFGQNLVPERPAGQAGPVLGTVRVGDPVAVLEEGPRPVAGR
ncbi:MOSC domain-containing protein [Streptacidiphilus sp. ASG 303]|uniref:MOSC domain-containing protein n=1 Tax=Streptacidiphilus sp. ASG 303 TaxID=2896847 RepID=UPI001E29DE00|nr:MOSC N-terminal beta barrel domain-containing protein [Streptacidiphilus sp. ASG 303]MCD0483760.1 MOSC domain-containing protein [Streptacidiphilus sp. ASG 303]